MSVEKLSDESELFNEGVPFAQISNDVILHVKNGDAFLVWCYLQSKSKNWKVIKQNIKNIYHFGDRKLKEILSYLNRSNLIKYVQDVGSNGRFGVTDIQVLNGTKFDKNQPFKVKGLVQAPVGHKTAPPVERTSGNDELLNKDITKQRKRTKDNISCPSGDERVTEFTQFDRFWSAYPRKQKKEAALRAWKKHKCEEQADEIVEHLITRARTEWRNKETNFIPLPGTFLNNEQWKDEIYAESTVKSTDVKTNAFNYALQNIGRKNG